MQNPDSIFGDLDIDNLSSFGFNRDFIEKIMVLQSKKKIAQKYYLIWDLFSIKKKIFKE